MNNSIDIVISAKDIASNVINNVNKNITDIAHNAGNNAVKGFNGLDTQIQSVSKGFLEFGTKAIAGVGVGLVGIGTMALNAATNFESMNASLLTAFNGNKAAADEAFSSIQKFAKETPYGLDETMRGFIKLKNMGLDPSQKALTAYGDTASSMGKSLNDMVEAVADAATGEFERLKEFGIRSSRQGDEVAFTFKGVTETVKMNSEDIENYLIKLGETNFAGGMKRQSETLGGMLSALKDDIGISLNQIANDSGLLDIAKDAVSGLGTIIKTWTPPIIDFLSKIGNVVKGVIEYFQTWDINNEMLKNGLTNLFGDEVANNILNFLTQLESGIKTVNENAIQPFINFLLDNKEATIAGIAAVAGVMLYSLVPAIGTAIMTATPIIATFAAIAAAGFLLYQAWDTNFLGIKDLLINIWENYLVPAFTSIKDFLSVFIPQAINVLVNFWNNILLPIFDKLKWYWDNILFPVFRFIAEVFTSILNVAIAGFVGYWNNILLPAFSNLMNVYNQYIKPFVDFFIGKFNEMRPVLESIGGFIGNVFKNAMNGLIDNVNRGLRAVNKLIEQANKVPGVSITPFADIPRLAKGTSNFSGGMALVGENGPELVQMPYGSKVYNRSETSKMSEHAGNPINVYNNFYEVDSTDAQNIASRTVFNIKNLSLNY